MTLGTKLTALAELKAWWSKTSFKLKYGRQAFTMRVNTPAIMPKGTILNTAKDSLVVVTYTGRIRTSEGSKYIVKPINRHGILEYRKSDGNFWFRIYGYGLNFTQLSMNQCLVKELDS